MGLRLEYRHVTLICSGILVVCSLVSCRESKKPEVVHKEQNIPLAVLENRLGNLPGPIYQLEAVSPIPWQPWSRETFRLAEERNQMVMVIVAMPQFSSFKRILSSLEENPATVKKIRENYVPILVDGGTIRELGLLTEPLSFEVKRPVSSPFLIWMTPDGFPVNWAPFIEDNQVEPLGFFNQVSELVDGMWKEDPKYILENGRKDNHIRSEKLLQRVTNQKPAENPEIASLGGARNLLSLYDPMLRQLNGTGGLFPLGPLNTAVASVVYNSNPQTIKEKGKDMATYLMSDLLRSAMFDPLEGGAFSGRVGKTWDLPTFARNCVDQAKISATLFRVSQVDADPMILEKAKEVLNFAERTYEMNGLFTFGVIDAWPPVDWMWTVEEVRAVLPKEDAEWWIAATGMQELGNIPEELDIQKKFFRYNTVALVRPLEKTAEQLSIPIQQLQESYQRSRNKLTEIRSKRGKIEKADKTPNATASFRMVSAYAAAYSATGDVTYKDKAVLLMMRAQQEFFKDGNLYSVSPRSESLAYPEVIEARAFVHALAILAALDVSHITLKEEPMQWALNIAQSATEKFLKDGILFEASPSASILQLPICDVHCLFEESSGGLFALAYARSAGQSQELRSLLEHLARPLPDAAQQSSVIFSDAVTAALVRYQSVSILYGKDLSPEMAKMISTLPVQWFPRAAASQADELADGVVKIVPTNGDGKLVANPAQLMEEIQWSK